MQCSAITQNTKKTPRHRRLRCSGTQPEKQALTQHWSFLPSSRCGSFWPLGLVDGNSLRRLSRWAVVWPNKQFSQLRPNGIDELLSDFQRSNHLLKKRGTQFNIKSSSYSLFPCFALSAVGRVSWSWPAPERSTFKQSWK